MERNLSLFFCLAAVIACGTNNASQSQEGQESDTGTVQDDTDDTASYDTGTEWVTAPETGSDTFPEVGTDSNNDTDSRTDGEVSTDTGTSSAHCSEGATPHTTTSGRLVCCSADHPVFCDENDAGYDGGCWSDGVQCDNLLQCGDRWSACLAGSVPYCDASGKFICYPCEDEADLNFTASGRPACCSDDRPTFCDENSDGYQGGCWGGGVVCDTITRCDEKWLACTEEKLPFCDDTGVMVCVPCPDGTTRYEASSGRPACCDASRPKFCDSTSEGYPGGCWSEQTDCTTVVPCDDFWGACPAGYTAVCENGAITCES